MAFSNPTIHSAYLPMTIKRRRVMSSTCQTSRIFKLDWNSLHLKSTSKQPVQSNTWWTISWTLPSRRANTLLTMTLQLKANRVLQSHFKITRSRTFRSLQLRYKRAQKQGMLKPEHLLLGSIAKRLSGNKPNLHCQAVLRQQISFNALTATRAIQSRFHWVATFRRHMLERAIDSERRWRFTKEESQIAKTWSRLKYGSSKIRDLTQRSIGSSSQASRKISWLGSSRYCREICRFHPRNFSEHFKIRLMAF